MIRVLEDVQVLVAETGWIPGEQDPSPETEPRRTDIKPSLCTCQDSLTLDHPLQGRSRGKLVDFFGISLLFSNDSRCRLYADSIRLRLGRHAITRTNAKEPFIVPNAAEDFRFEKNASHTHSLSLSRFLVHSLTLDDLLCVVQPYNTTQGGSLAFYASANIVVPTQRTSSPSFQSNEQHEKEPVDEEEDCPDELPVGSLCLIDNKPKHEGEFSEEDIRLLQDLAFMVGQEVRFSYFSTLLA